MPEKRTSHEESAVATFLAAARSMGIAPCRKEKVRLLGSTGFEFGDLRVDGQEGHVVLEVESAGGSTNLAKYWHLIVAGHSVQPVFLIHVFRTGSPRDWMFHMDVWHTLVARMHAELSERFHAELFTYDKRIGVTEAAPAVVRFREFVSAAVA